MIYIRKATLCKNSTEQTREIQEGNKKTGKIQKKNTKKKKRRWRRRRRRPPNNKRITRERELRKEGSESLVVSPQAQDQSKRVPLKDASI